MVQTSSVTYTKLCKLQGGQTPCHHENLYYWDQQVNALKGQMIILNHNIAGGADSAHTFFQWLFHLEIKVPEGSNLLTFPIHLSTTPLYPFESTKLLKKGVLDHFCQQRVKNLELGI